MTVIAMLSAKGSPGVSTTALACTLTWPGPTLLAECDPAGGDLLSGYLSRYELPAGRGVLPLAGAALRGATANDLAGQLIDLDGGRQQRMVLPGLNDPAQSAAVGPAWAQLAELFAGMKRTVFVDCGRMAAPNTPWPLLARADLVLLVIRPTSIRTVSPAVPAIAHLRRELQQTQDHVNPHTSTLGLLLIGHGIAAREIAQHLRVPVLGRIAWDPLSAAALCGEGRGKRNGNLTRSAIAARLTIQGTIETRREARAALTRRDTDEIPRISAAR